MINFKNIDDNEGYKRLLVRYLNSADHHPARIKKANKDFAKKFHFEWIEFLVKITRHLQNWEKESSALVFLVMKTRKNIHVMY